MRIVSRIAHTTAPWACHARNDTNAGKLARLLHMVAYVLRGTSMSKICARCSKPGHSLLHSLPKKLPQSSGRLEQATLASRRMRISSVSHLQNRRYLDRKPSQQYKPNLMLQYLTGVCSLQIRGRADESMILTALSLYGNQIISWCPKYTMSSKADAQVWRIHVNMYIYLRYKS